MVSELFEIRGSLDKKTRRTLSVVGLVILFSLWASVTVTGLIPAGIFPSPFKVLGSFGELHFNDSLVLNIIYSLKLNYMGYIEAILVCIPIGFVIGLFPGFNAAFKNHVNAIRFVPLTAVTGLFVVWFGIEILMKVQFLAFGIIVYLLPVVVQRVSEVEDVYQQTAFTLGATKWQMIRSVFFPAVLTKLSDDIRVLVAISWTYIIIAEMVNAEGGIGAMIYQASRQSRVDKVMALLFTIVIIGFVQDKIFYWVDKKLFKYKYVT